LFERLLPNIEKVLSRYPHLFLSGLGYTLLLSVITVSFGVMLGSLVALMRRSRVKPISLIATAYVEIIRGTPLLLQLYFFAFLLPEMLPILELSNFTCICVALVLTPLAM
jgi:His/Glu/Gln/Arg/opine family amino acid ABC transporter permease subunit